MELQGVVDEVVRTVCRLHGRLSAEACWTRNLQEEAEESRKMVEGLVAQVNGSVLQQGRTWSARSFGTPIREQYIFSMVARTPPACNTLSHSGYIAY